MANLSLVVIITCIMSAVQNEGWLHHPIFASDIMFIPILIFILLAPSLMMGAIQWIAFANKVEHSPWWIFATALGSSLSVLLLNLLNFSEFSINEIVLAFLIGAIVGILIGFPQWLVLQGEVRGAFLWLEGSISGWACAVCAAYILWQTGMGMLVTIIGLLPMGMITGVAYAYLFSQPSQKSLGQPAILQ